MADVKITSLTALSPPLTTDILPIVGDPGGTPQTKKVTLADLGHVIGALLEEHVASASASLDFTTRNKNGYTGATFQSDFDDYILFIDNLLPATDNVTASARVSTNGGSSFDSGSNYRFAYNYRNTNAAGGNGGNNSATSLEICGNLDNTGAGACGQYRFVNPLGGSTKHIAGHVTFLHNDTFHYRTDSGWWYVSASAVNAFQLFMSSGNIASGVARLYGVWK